MRGQPGVTSLSHLRPPFLPQGMERCAQTLMSAPTTPATRESSARIMRAATPAARALSECAGTASARWAAAKRPRAAASTTAAATRNQCARTRPRGQCAVRALFLFNSLPLSSHVTLRCQMCRPKRCRSGDCLTLVLIDSSNRRCLHPRLQRERKHGVRRHARLHGQPASAQLEHSLRSRRGVLRHPRRAGHDAQRHGLQVRAVPAGAGRGRHDLQAVRHPGPDRVDNDGCAHPPRAPQPAAGSAETI